LRSAASRVEFLFREGESASARAEDATRGVVTGGAGNAATRMRAGPAKPQAFKGCAVSCEAWHGPHEEKLLEIDVAVKDISLGDAEGLLEVERRQDLARDDRAWNVWSVSADYFDDPVAQALALVLPGTAGQSIRKVLHEAGEDMPALRDQP